MVACCDKKSEVKTYEPTWSSLGTHQIPEWLMDAKFGIYSHWGPQSYQYEHLSEEVSTLEAFENWKGENFDASAWADLFLRAGAQFAGPVAQHCTGCLNWDSEITDWNSVNHGPGIDILGEISREIKKRDMKFIATFHSVTSGSTWGQISTEDREFIEPSFEYDSVDRVDTRWMKGYEERINEATTKYGVDIMWFDSSLGFSIGGEMAGYIDQGKFIPNKKLTKKNARVQLGSIQEASQQRIVANFYNNAEKAGKDVAVVYKSQDLPWNIGMRNIENGNLTGGQYDPWMTDIDIQNIAKGSWKTWFYNKDCGIKDANVIVDLLVDITAKNGRLLLNVPPKSDGTFAEKLKNELYRIGDWLKVNGEAIYGTTPWFIYGEGPTEIKHPGHHGYKKAYGDDCDYFTAEDYRYTSKGEDLYAFALDRPESGSVLFAALGSEYKLYPNEVKDVQLLGYAGEVEWEQQPKGLKVVVPADAEDSFAYCFKVIR